VYVADDVEGAVLVLQVVPQARPLKRGRGHLLRRGEDVYVPEALPFQPLARAFELPDLARDHVRAEVAVAAAPVAFAAELLWHVQHYGDG